MKLMKPFYLVIMIALVLTACGGGVKNNTQEAAAKTFVQAMIDGDEKKLDAINKSSFLDFPTHYLISDFAPDYADRKLKDFSFDADPDNGIVVIKSNDGEIDVKLKIQKIGKEYFFTGTSR